MTSLTQEGQGYKEQLTVLMFTHFGIAIAKIILMGIMFGFGDIFQVLILWCGFAQHNYCNVFIYMLACLMLSLQIFMVGGFAVQTGSPLSSAFKSTVSGVSGNVLMVFSIICLCFYVVAIFISFRAYREFKYSAQINGRGAGLENPLNYGSIKD